MFADILPSLQKPRIELGLIVVHEFRAGKAKPDTIAGGLALFGVQVEAAVM